MVDQIIRPAALPNRPSPVATEKIPVDNGSTVGGATVEAIVLSGRPTASQAEAESGVDASKAMTPLTTKQAIDSQVPPKISAAITALNLGTASQSNVGAFATAAQGAKADSALQSVVAGSNVTVNNADPRNPIVSSTGGIPDGDKGDVIVSGGGAVWTVETSALAYLSSATDAQTRTLGSRLLDFVSVKDFGALGNGVADDYTALQNALNYARLNRRWLFWPEGRYRTTQTLTWHGTVASGVYGHAPIFIGEGHKSSILINAIAAGGTTLDIYAVTNLTFLSGGLIAGIGFEQSVTGTTSSHGIEYEGLWHSCFSRIRVQGMSGAGLKVNNPGDGDGKSSAHVRFEDSIILGNGMAGWTSQGGNAGVSTHTFDNCDFKDNGKTAGIGQIIIDGTVRMVMRMCSVTSSDTTTPCVRILRTNVVSQDICFDGGEYGNGSGVHFVIDSVLNFESYRVRHVRRTGETTSQFGYYFSGSGGGVAIGVTIEHPILAIDTATPPWTFLFSDVANADITVLRPRVSSFVTGNIPYNISGSGLSAKYQLDDFDGRRLVEKPIKRVRVEPSTTSTITPDPLVAGWWQIIPQAAGTYTIGLPSLRTDGSEIIITVYRTATINTVFNAAYTIRTTPANDVVTTLTFRFDAASVSWRQV